MHIIQGILTYFEEGGAVMIPLGIATFVLWYALGLRFMTLRWGSGATSSELIDAYRDGRAKPYGLVDTAAHLCLRAADGVRNPRPFMDDACALIERELGRGRTIIKSMCAAAPLTGLLGTVTGMIETFDSLADMTLHSQSGGIAGGIAQALFTTQMGLVVAVPGILLGRALDRRQARIEGEIARIKDLISGHHTATR